MKSVKATYNNAIGRYNSKTAQHTALSSLTATTLRDKEMIKLAGEILELVDALGYILEMGHVPYGREVAKLLYPIPSYSPNQITLSTGARGLALALRTGQLSLELEEQEDERQGE